MALFDDIDSLRELVKRLVLAELLARPGRGPLALRGAAAFRSPAPPGGARQSAAAAKPPETPGEQDR